LTGFDAIFYMCRYITWIGDIFLSVRSQEQVALLTDYDTHSAYCEAYYTLLANIRFSWKHEETVQTLLVTTPAPVSGYATAAANIAIASAQSGVPTVLVDADMREANLEQRFGLQQHSGLSDLFVEKSLTSQLVAQSIQPTFVPGLFLVSSGTAKEDVALLLPTKFEGALQAISAHITGTNHQSGVVIFNSSPVLVGPDASLIGSYVAQTILLIARKRTTRTQAKQAQEQLQRAQANLSGLVMLDL
jgi:capsular exopolysaccharide synthesis family protein